MFESITNGKECLPQGSRTGMVSNNFLFEPKPDLMAGVMLYYEDEGIISVISAGANALFLKVARCRVLGDQSPAAYICCSVQCIAISAETFLDTLQWLNALFANNIEIKMLNFITEPQKVPGP